jgi:hypothetical protein
MPLNNVQYGPLLTREAYSALLNFKSTVDVAVEKTLAQASKHDWPLSLFEGNTISQLPSDASGRVLSPRGDGQLCIDVTTGRRGDLTGRRLAYFPSVRLHRTRCLPSGKRLEENSDDSAIL